MDIKRFIGTFSINLIVLIAFLVIYEARGAELSPEEEENAVDIKFYLLTSEKWPDREDEFRKEVARSLTAYCEENSAQCGLKGWLEDYVFRATDVTVVSTQDEKYQLLVRFYVTYNSVIDVSARNVTDTTVPKVGVNSALAESYRELNAAVDSNVVGIDGVEYSPEPDMRLNLIIIVVSCVVLLILIIITIALCKWRGESCFREYKQRQSHILKDVEKREADRKDRKLKRESKTDDAKGGSSSKVAPAPKDRDVEANNGGQSHRSGKHSHRSHKSRHSQSDEKEMTHQVTLETRPKSPPSPPILISHH